MIESEEITDINIVIIMYNIKTHDKVGNQMPVFKAL